MMEHSTTAARIGRLLRYGLLVLGLALVWPQIAQAGHGYPPSTTCSPQNVTVPYGGSVEITACNTGFGIIDVQHPPTHGTTTVLDWGDVGVPARILYEHDAVGSPTATSDSFTHDDGSGKDVTVNITIEAGEPPLQIDPPAIPVAYAGEPYSVQLTASGGDGSYSWSLASGSSLPAGLSLSTGGLISGTTTHRQDDFIFTVQVSDATETGSQTYSLDVEGGTLTLAPNPPPDAYINHPYSVTFSTGGGVAPHTVTLNSGSLPPGLTLSGHTLSGTPTALGSYTFELMVDDASTGSGTTTNRELIDVTLTVNPQPTITVTGPLDAPQVGAAYSDSVSAGGGTAPYTYAISAGALPPGLTLDVATGALTGTPTAGGGFGFTISATDASTFPGSASFNLTVAAADIVLSAAALPAAKIGDAYTASVSASGGTAPYSYTVTAGALPAGLALDSTTGGISGTPTAGGSFTVTVTATDSSTGTGAPYSDSLAYPLSVAAPTIAITPAGLPDGTTGNAYSQTLAASGGTAPYSWALASGALPAGLALSTGGVLSGTPTAFGSFSFTVGATDSSTGAGPYPETRAYTLTIASSAPVANDSSANVGYGSGASPIGLSLSGGSADSIAVGTAPAHGTAVVSGTTISYQPDGGYAGADSFSYTASNASGTSAPATVSITVANPVITVTAAAPLTTPVGQPYSQTFQWSGGAAPYSGYSVTGLPAGLAVSTSDSDSVTVSGTPTAAGSFTLAVTATDSSSGDGPFTGGDSFLLDVTAPGLVMTPVDGSSLDIVYAQPYSRIFAASGGTAPYSYTLTGTLPNGLSFDPVSGALTGTPTQTGSFPVTVTATDSSAGPGAPFQLAHDYVLQVDDAMQLGALPDGTAGVAYDQQVDTTGGFAPYVYALNVGTTLPPGLSLAPDGRISGTPSVAGSYSFNLRATDVNGATAAHGYNLTIATPSIALTPPALPAGVAGLAYAQPLSAGGGAAPYTFAVSAGALPGGLMLAADGGLSGTPTTVGSSSFTVQATDANGYGGTHAYTLAIIDAVPVAVDDRAGTAAEQPVTIAVTANDSGVIDAIAIATAAANGNVTVNGLGAVYTPTAGFFGTDRFTYTAVGPGGSSTAATVIIKVTALPVPVARAQVLSTLAGAAVTFDAAAGASGGPFTGVTVVTAPTAGELKTAETLITYTPPMTAAGAVTIGYTLANAYGASAPISTTITVNPVPIARAHRARTLAGTTVTVELTDKAHGGPFTGAEVLSVSPAEAGTAKVARVGDGEDAGYRLSFAAAADYAGTATLRYTLSNAHATSAPAVVTIEVVPRSDPSRDPEVTGLLRAQTAAARHLARGQIDNFQQRLERLHRGRDGSAGFDNGLSVAIERPCGERDWQIVGSTCPRPLADEQAPVLSPAAPAADAGARTPLFAIWSSGAMRFGEYDPRRGASGFEFETRGISLGADYHPGPDFALGAGLGYGRDVSEIGEHGSRNEADAWSAALYASYHPGDHFYLDGLLGHQWLSFQLRRHVTANGAQVSGDRDGRQWFASLAAGYQWQHAQWGFAPYARVDVAQATLDGYVEQGDPVQALAFAEQDIDTTTTGLGLRLDYRHERDWGAFVPQLRLEYQHDVDADSMAVIRYADLPTGPFYRAGIDGFDRNRLMIGLGAGWSTARDLGVRLEYRSLLGNSGADDQAVMLQVEKQY